MTPPLKPHTFEVNPERQPYCVHCSLPEDNRIHTLQRVRTRVVVTLDHEATVTPNDIAKVLTDTWGPYRDVSLYDLRILP